MVAAVASKVIAPALSLAQLGPVLKVAGPIFFLGLQSASVNTALKIANDKSTGQLSALPFVSLLTNCIIWTLYGYLKSDNTVLVPNAIGIVAGGFGTFIYNKYSADKPLKIYAASVILSAIASFLAFTGNWYALGLLGCLLAVAVSGSPLATLKTVIRDKSTASLPFPTSLATWCNAFSWSLYGLMIAHDPMIFGPNLMGLTLATIQMSLFVAFGMPPRQGKAKINDTF